MAPGVRRQTLQRTKADSSPGVSAGGIAVSWAARRRTQRPAASSRRKVAPAQPPYRAGSVDPPRSAPRGRGGRFRNGRRRESRAPAVLGTVRLQGGPGLPRRRRRELAVGGLGVALVGVLWALPSQTPRTGWRRRGDPRGGFPTSLRPLDRVPAAGLPRQRQPGLPALPAVGFRTDSAGMLGRIIFAWWKGTKLDCNAKQWRLFADILNDVAMFLEIMAPIYPMFFTMIVCTSNLAKCIVSVAGGATRAALTMHQARRNNMADVSAKDSSQETLVNLAGLLVSLLMLPLVSASPGFSLGCFFFLTALHIYANYRAVRALVLETLNEGRLRLVLKHFLQRGEVLGPTSANQMEPLWTGCWPSLSLSLGVPLHRLISSVFELQQLVEGHQEPYLLHWDKSPSRVQVVLSQTAGPETILRAAIHGLVLEALQGEGPLPTELTELRNQVRAGPEKDSWVIVREIHQVLDKLFPKFLKGLQDAGWKTEKHQLEVDEWRATWLLSPEKKIL
ncbi:RUS family member 1 isoform X3 [Mustela putorius furo]|uniref:RUS family member 1 isoform X3 n=1 Tax=Mustela putorius furo TaxID=9669 RepID=A0A8U0UU93_MUSPF|nr:RUS family member 1 isoform X3 [Mustela putorius furo]